jgi:uncharacterized protein
MIMSYGYNHAVPADQASADARVGFIRRTYGHLAGAVLAFAGIEAVLVNLPGIENLVMPMLQAWWLVLLLFLGVSYVADRWAHSTTSPGMQYLGLGLYVVVEAFICLPLLYYAKTFSPNAIGTAGILTLSVFGGLTVAVFATRKDYSNIAPIISIGGMLALGFVIASLIFPMGNMVFLIFCFFMVALVSATIIYQTSNVLHHYQTDQHVAAALALFASIATLFYYILYIASMLSGRD